MTLPWYTVLAVASVVAVVLLERRRWRTGLFRRPSFWVSLGICLIFMILVDGWLTKLSAPIVLYAPEARVAWRFPWDIPVEDYLFGFALLAAATARWLVLGRDPAPPDPTTPERAEATAS